MKIKQRMATKDQNLGKNEVKKQEFELKSALTNSF